MHSLVVYAKKVHRNGNNNWIHVAKNSANNECLRCISGRKLCYYCHREWAGVAEKWFMFRAFRPKIVSHKTHANELYPSFHLILLRPSDNVEQNFHLCFMARASRESFTVSPFAFFYSSSRNNFHICFMSRCSCLYNFTTL